MITVTASNTDTIKIGSFKGIRSEWKSLSKDQKDAFWIEHENRGIQTTVAIVGNCSKCGGTGKIGYYNHVAGGTCFRCGGKGSVK